MFFVFFFGGKEKRYGENQEKKEVLVCTNSFERGGKTYLCQAPLLPENEFCSVCFPTKHKTRNRQLDVEKKRKIADEKKKQEAEARRLEVEKKKKIAYEKKKQEARKKLQELTEKIENKYKSRFEKEKIKAIEIVKKESANELQKHKSFDMRKS